MKFISTSCASLGLALLLNGLPLTAQIKAGQPDPTYSGPAALDLPYALAFALDNNFAIRQAKERIRQQDGVVLEVRSTQIPTVAAGGSLQRNDTRVARTGIGLLVSRLSKRSIRVGEYRRRCGGNNLIWMLPSLRYRP